MCFAPSASLPTAPASCYLLRPGPGGRVPRVSVNILPSPFALRMVSNFFLHLFILLISETPESDPGPPLSDWRKFKPLPTCFLQRGSQNYLFESSLRKIPNFTMDPIPWLLHPLGIIRLILYHIPHNICLSSLKYLAAWPTRRDIEFETHRLDIEFQLFYIQIL